MERRKFLKGAVALASFGTIAGCLGSDEGSSEKSNDGNSNNKNDNGEAQTSTETETSSKPKGEPSAKILTSELKVDKGQYSTDYTGYVEIKNDGDVSLTNPKVKVEFLNSEGSLLDSTESTIVILRPGQKWEVRSMFTGTESTPESVEATLDPIEKVQTKYKKPKGISQSGVELSTGEDITVTGELTNETGSDKDIAAYTQFLDDDGSVIGTATDLINGVSSGQRWSFNCEFYGTSDEAKESISDYKLMVYAE